MNLTGWAELEKKYGGDQGAEKSGAALSSRAPCSKGSRQKQT